jgi:uncharacterized protein (UPF0218 family)
MLFETTGRQSIVYGIKREGATEFKIVNLNEEIKEHITKVLRRLRRTY